jgi:metal-responsive CopG/Arc/MetJ family transcriptional regulator
MYNFYTIIREVTVATEATRRINVTFPVSLLEELRRYVPRRKRSEFIAEATEKELKRVRLLKVLGNCSAAVIPSDRKERSD